MSKLASATVAAAVTGSFLVQYSRVCQETLTGSKLWKLLGTYILEHKLLQMAHWMKLSEEVWPFKTIQLSKDLKICLVTKNVGVSPGWSSSTYSDVKPGCLPYLSPPHEDRKMMMMILLNKIFGYLVTTPPHDRKRFNISDSSWSRSKLEWVGLPFIQSLEPGYSRYSKEDSASWPPTATIWTQTEPKLDPNWTELLTKSQVR